MTDSDALCLPPLPHARTRARVRDQYSARLRHSRHDSTPAPRPVVRTVRTSGLSAGPSWGMVSRVRNDRETSLVPGGGRRVNRWP